MTTPFIAMPSGPRVGTSVTFSQYSGSSGIAMRAALWHGFAEPRSLWILKAWSGKLVVRKTRVPASRSTHSSTWLSSGGYTDLTERYSVSACISKAHVSVKVASIGKYTDTPSRSVQPRKPQHSHHGLDSHHGHHRSYDFEPLKPACTSPNAQTAEGDAEGGGGGGGGAGEAEGDGREGDVDLRLHSTLSAATAKSMADRWISHLRGLRVKWYS